MPTVRVKAVDKLARTPEDKSNLYYTRSEMHGFYLEVREFQSSCKKDAVPPRECLVRLDADPALRGLELFFYPLRVRNKIVARNNLLKYYKALNDENNCCSSSMTEEQKFHAFAAASAKVSQWSKLVARETARLDSLRVNDTHISPISAPKTTDIVDTIPAIKRRTVSFDDDDDDDSQPSSKRRRL